VRPDATEPRRTAEVSERIEGAPLVEVLYFDECPNHEPAVALVERLGRELGIEPELRLVNVPDQETAERLRFLGSPTVPIAGIDVDPLTEERSDYALSCRVFRTEAGIAGQPDESWVREALLREAGAWPLTDSGARRRSEARTDAGLSAQAGVTAEPELSEVVEHALSAAGIAPARFGPARLEQLSESERKLYRWILERFAQGGRPKAEQLRDRASELGIEIETTLASFATLDLVHHDQASGEILVAYPFSARPRGHSVLIDGTQRVEAMCAIDALGIAPMLELPLEITSHDPHSGGQVRVRLDPDDGAWWEPITAVVLAGSACCDGPSFRGCCDVLNFFESPDTADHYLSKHPELAGFPISIPEAVEAGHAVFANLLKER
jgi:hypothetical protein